MIASIFFMRNGLHWTETAASGAVSPFFKQEACQICREGGADREKAPPAHRLSVSRHRLCQERRVQKVRILTPGSSLP
jgi:hypothetical protein